MTEDILDRKEPAMLVDDTDELSVEPSKSISTYFNKTFSVGLFIQVSEDFSKTDSDTSLDSLSSDRTSSQQTRHSSSSVGST